MRPITRGAHVVVGGHSRGVGKTLLIERMLDASRERRWIAIKISAHRHAPEGRRVPLVEESRQPSPLTQTGRYLLAGADRAFLIRAPDAALACAAAFIESLREAGRNVVVESNRIVRYLRPDALLFVVDPAIGDWKASSWECLSAGTVLVSSHVLKGARCSGDRSARASHAELVNRVPI